MAPYLFSFMIDAESLILGVALGVVRDLMATGPHSVLVLEYHADEKPAERMIPFVSAYVDKVDKAAGMITVDWQPDY